MNNPRDLNAATIAVGLLDDLRHWEHGEECAAWEEEVAPVIDTTACDCGVARLAEGLRSLVAYLSQPAPGVPPEPGVATALETDRLAREWLACDAGRGADAWAGYIAALAALIAHLRATTEGETA